MIRASLWENLAWFLRMHVAWERGTCGGSKHFLEAPSSKGVTLNRKKKNCSGCGGRFYHHNRTKTTRHSLSHRYPRATDILLKTEPSASDTDPSQDPHDASRVALSPGFCCTRLAGTKLFPTSSTQFIWPQFSNVWVRPSLIPSPPPQLSSLAVRMK